MALSTPDEFPPGPIRMEALRTGDHQEVDFKSTHQESEEHHRPRARGFTYSGNVRRLADRLDDGRGPTGRAFIHVIALRARWTGA